MVRNFFLTLVFGLWAILSLQAQKTVREDTIVENGKTFLLHKVIPGETLYSISKQYNVGLPVLSKVNPQIANGLKSGEILKIPVSDQHNPMVKSDQEREKPSQFLSHKVQRKETLYFIAHQYGITIDDILEYNPGLTRLKKGDIVKIPQWTSSPAKVESPKKVATGQSGKKITAGQSGAPITHFVQPGETLYSISQKYGKSVSTILEMNPGAGDLKPGMRLKIPSGPAVAASPSEGQEFDKHTIEKGETLYSLSKRFNISADRLVELNPSLGKNCKAGSVIRIPASAHKSKSVVSVNGKEEIHHVVVSGETLYGLSQMYQVPMEEIVRENPFLESRAPRVGDTLIIATANKGESGRRRVSETGNTKEEPSSECTPRNSTHLNHKTFKIALLLPIMLDSNRSLNQDILSNLSGQGHLVPESGTDTLRTAKSQLARVQFQGNSENYIHFYEGVLLAVDSLEQMGIKMDLEVLDTEQKSSRVKNFVSSGALNNTDLIIGPVYPNEQKEISEFALKNRIPVVSPLSPSDEYTKGNPYFFQINPPKEYVAARTTEYLGSAYKSCNIVILQTGSSESEAESEMSRLKSEFSRNGGSLKNVAICNFKKEGYSGLREKMIKDRKNVVVIPSTNEAEVSVVVSNIKSLIIEFDLTLVGNNRFPQFDSVNPENYHQGKLEFLTPYWPDAENPVAHSFVSKFRNYFRAEPNQYSMQGYDVTFFFVKAMHDFGSDFRGCITSEKAELVQGKYHFKKITSGGYINNGLSVIQYLPSYEIIRKKIITN